MSEHSRYEEMDQQFNDLPMPDEEASWQKMKEILKDNDDDGIAPPPVFLKSCLGWGILFLAGLTIAWLLARPEKWWKEASKTNQTSSSNKNQKEIVKEHPVVNKTKTSKQGSFKENTEKKTTSSQPLNQTNGEKIATDSQPHEVASPGKPQKNQQPARSLSTDKISVNNQNLLLNKKQNIKPTIQKPALRKEQEDLLEITSKEKKRKKIEKKNTDSFTINQPHDKIINEGGTDEKRNNKKADTAITVTKEAAILRGDTAKKVNIVSPTDALNQKKTNPKNKKLLIAAGIGEQQLIPIAGQTTVPYSRYGRRGSLADYVPSLFIQLQKERKWFGQTEFRYGAVQSVKEFPYNQNTKYDALNNNVTTTTMRLKKTYYHQLPVSFNYFLLSNLSIGIGGMYSHFYGAVTEREITTLNTQTQAVSTIKQIIPVKHFTDSFLYKTQVHALLQADYHWKKFSFGLRYTKDMQPYIKYTKPDGTVDEEKNQSLQFMIRYRLWQSQKL
jgi:hypothetical protein